MLLFVKATEFKENRHGFCLSCPFSLGVSSVFSPSTLQEWSICASQATRGGGKNGMVYTSGHIWIGLHTVTRRCWAWAPCLRVLACAVVQQCCKFMHRIWRGFRRERDHLLERPTAKTNKSAGRSKYGHNSHWEKFSSLYVLLSLFEYVCVCVRDTQHSREVEGQ